MQMKSERQLMAMRKAITAQHGAMGQGDALPCKTPAAQPQAAVAC